MKLILFFFFIFSFTVCYANKVEELANRYNIKIYSTLNNHFYGINWKENNFDIRFTQISDKETEVVSNTIDSCFSSYYPEIITNCFDEIFLVHSITFNGQKMTVLKVANLLYVAADTTKQEILNQIHKNIAELIFDKYHYLFEKEFKELNPSFFNYGDNIEKNNLVKYGFINKNASKSLKNDFISLFVLNIEKKSDSLISLASKSPIIKNKFDLIRKTYNKLKPSNIKFNNNIQKKVNRIKKQYNVDIDYSYSIFNFPNTWIKKNYQPIGLQIDSSHLNILLSYLNDFLCSNYLESYFLTRVIVIKDMMIKNKAVDVASYNSTLFLSDNFIEEYSEQKCNILIANTLFRLVYQNLYSYFPVDKWNKINQLAKDSAYLSKFGKQYFYYDFRDFYFAFLNGDSTHISSSITKKMNIIKNFYSTAKNKIQNVNIDSIKIQKDILEQKYHVNIIDFYDNNYNDYTFPHTLVINEKINLFQLTRTLDILPTFLENIKKTNLKKYINNIFLVGNMEYLQGTDKVGGTFETTQKSIFLANIGNNKKFIEGTLYHELSSLILYARKKDFPKQKWIAVNDSDFHYGNLQEYEKNIYEGNEELYKSGFIDGYGTTCFENDYNEFFKLYFLDKEKLEELATKYQKINSKFLLLKQFLEN